MPWANRGFGYTNLAEKLCAGFAYFTFGMSGLLYMLLAKSRHQSELFRFHVVQASLLWVLSWLISMALQPVMGICLNLFGAVAPGPAAVVAGALGLIIQGVTIAFSLLLVYGAIFAFLGKFAEVLFISHLVRANMTRWG